MWESMRVSHSLVWIWLKSYKYFFFSTQSEFGVLWMMLLLVQISLGALSNSPGRTENRAKAVICSLE